MVRVVVVNGSHNAEKGNTDKILNPFIAGMSSAGAKVERYYAARLNIKPCAGEFICWNSKPGTCHIQDDMQMLYPILKEAEIFVMATPVYVPLPGEMQNFMNRLMPLFYPYLNFKDGRTRATFRADVKINTIALVSTCGWWEMGNFGTVLRIAEELASDASIKFAGALLRPHSDELGVNKEKTNEIYEALKRVGFDFISKGNLDKSTLDIISQPLISEEDYRKTSNDTLVIKDPQ